MTVEDDESYEVCSFKQLQKRPYLKVIFEQGLRGGKGSPGRHLGRCQSSHLTEGSVEGQGGGMSKVHWGSGEGAGLTCRRARLWSKLHLRHLPPPLSGRHGRTKVGGPHENQAGSATPTWHKMLVYALILCSQSRVHDPFKWYIQNLRCQILSGSILTCCKQQNTVFPERPTPREACQVH